MGDLLGLAQQKAVKNFDKDFPSEMHFESRWSVRGFRCRN